MITVTIRFFAAIKDITGMEFILLILHKNSTLHELQQELVRQFPEFGKWKNFVRFAINQQYCGIDSVLHDKDEVAIIPPVSGG